MCTYICISEDYGYGYRFSSTSFDLRTVQTGQQKQLLNTSILVANLLLYSENLPDHLNKLSTTYMTSSISDGAVNVMLTGQRCMAGSRKLVMSLFTSGVTEAVTALSVTRQ